MDCRSHDTAMRAGRRSEATPRPPKARTPGGNRANAEENAERTASVAPAAADAKSASSTLIARLALRGFEARELPDGAGFVCGRWGLSKHCATFDELQAFAVRVGAC